ncbi:hypothetical protein C474_13599 [Halogeometricum pallidum JCM 14848]|uniref:Uncharacterized protein n=2 Tax=Halogeometricum TaxID=60846 RepID=M0D4M6_HALPD|nr:hypothetical protein C474_13599 [Halogeometricum pallidum JCM 14848]
MMEMAFDDETGIPDDDGLQRCIWGAHEYQAKELVESRDLKRITGQKPRIGNCTAVLQKSYAWIGGESLPSREEGFLLNIGLSPTEIMDYRAVEHGHRTTVQSWAEKRDEPQRKIVENIDRAKEKLHSHFE